VPFSFSPQYIRIEARLGKQLNQLNKEVQGYIDSIPEERKPLFNKLKSLILELYPDAEVKMWYRMPTFKVKSGWVALANQKHYVSLYTNSAEHIRKFKAKYPTIKTGTACLNLRLKDPIPEDAIKGVIEHAMEHSK
jgi:uncharacterized protein YdhG (YjbR/CyaY superfamily)